ncbi:MAG TPA: ABC transporter permease [Candidatus Thermoplasmatota archaeon]|nr:ABC transporter permease [Candidatus Thermoplasmatota archaeon]
MIPPGEVASILALTVQVSAAGTLLGALVGVPAGLALAGRGAGRRAVRAAVYALYALPPVVAGLLVYLALSASGPLGGLDLLFTPGAIVVAEAILAAPLIAGLTVAAVAEVPSNVREAIEAAGGSRFFAARALLCEARHGVAAAVMVGFGRALAEVAAALVVGGNIRHETRTLGTAILQEIGQGRFESALVLAAILLALALATVAALARLARAHPEAAP